MTPTTCKGRSARSAAQNRAPDEGPRLESFCCSNVFTLLGKLPKSTSKVQSPESQRGIHIHMRLLRRALWVFLLSTMMTSKVLGAAQAQRILTFALCLSAVSQLSAAPVFRKDKLAEMDAAINEAIADKRCPGGVL